MELTQGQLVQVAVFTIYISVLIGGLGFALFISKVVPDKFFMGANDNQTLHRLTKDMKVAQNHFNEAVTPGEIEASSYEVKAAKSRIDEFRRKAGLDECTIANRKAAKVGDRKKQARLHI